MPEFNVLLGGVGGKAGKVGELSSIILNGADNKAAYWTIYQGLKKVKGQGEELFLYIGKAKNGVTARYSANDLKTFSIEAFDLLKKIPDNGTALGIEQAIMDLNGWAGKAANMAKPVLSNKNAAAIKEIYKSAGLQWLNENVKSWQTIFKIK